MLAARGLVAIRPARERIARNLPCIRRQAVPEPQRNRVGFTKRHPGTDSSARKVRGPAFRKSIEIERHAVFKRRVIFPHRIARRRDAHVIEPPESRRLRCEHRLRMGRGSVHQRAARFAGDFLKQS